MFPLSRPRASVLTPSLRVVFASLALCAAPAVAQQAEDPPRLRAERDAVHRHDVAVGLAQPLDLDHERSPGPT